MDFSLRTIYLMLGPACNMSCKHCSQHDYLETYDLVPRKEGLCDEVFDVILKMSKRNKYSEVYFWGGEPLLYWKTIQQTVDRFEKAGIKNIRYKIQTNGLLLKKEILDYCKEHNFEVGISFDAPNPTALRGSIPSDAVIQLFNEYDGPKHVHSVFTSENKDFKEMCAYIKQKFPNVRHSIGYFMVIGEAGRATIQFEKGEVYRKITEFLDTPKGKEFMRYRGGRNRWYDPEAFPWVVFPMCNHGNSVHVFDYYGNAYLCHNVNIIVGHVKDGYDALVSKYAKAWRERLAPACKNCEIVEYCYCRCPVEIREGDEYASCKYFKEMIHAFIDYRSTHE